jgi:hypothetical protein
MEQTARAEGNQPAKKNGGDVKKKKMNDNCKCDVYKCVLCVVYYTAMFTCT